MSASQLTIEVLERWEASGAQWRVVEITADTAVVDLCACTGEPVDRVETRNPEMIAHLGQAQVD